jgi:RNA polymerase sigma-70 factor (ECF subfamily)
MLAENAQAIGDGGGRVPSFLHALEGADRITNLYWAISRRLGDRAQYRMAQLNGEAGLLRYVDGQLESAQAFVTDGERIVAIYTVRNPAKLAGVQQRLVA